MKDWTGGTASTYKAIGASNHSDTNREQHDFYATDGAALDALATQTDFFNGVNKVWECAAGQGDLSERIKKYAEVVSSDLYDYGYCESGVDFLASSSLPKGVDAIITNPPYKFATPFCEKCIELGVPKFALFLKLTFLEGKARRDFFAAYPPRYVHVFSNRVMVAKNGKWEDNTGGSAVCYAWFVWEKGYKGKPEITWLWKNQ